MLIKVSKSHQTIFNVIKVKYQDILDATYNLENALVTIIASKRAS